MQKRILLIILLLFSSVSFSNKSNLLSSGLPSLAPMLENVTPAVVNIYTINEVEEKNNQIDDLLYRKFFNIPGKQETRKRNRSGLGSGVIINSKSQGYKS
jgi:S1-C subfamily serine protease